MTKYYYLKKNGYDDVRDLKFVCSWKAQKANFRTKHFSSKKFTYYLLRAVKVFEISQNVKFLLTLLQAMLLRGESD